MDLPNPGQDAVPFTTLTAEFYDNTIENIEALAEMFGVSYTTWATAWTNLTVGAGGVVTNGYIEIGKWVIGFIGFKYGSGSSISGAIKFSLPATAATTISNVGLRSIGEVDFLDLGNAVFRGAVALDDVNTAVLTAHNSAGTYEARVNTSGTIPINGWATNDELLATFAYLRT